MYCTVDELKGHLHELADHRDDLRLAAQITAASRAIDAAAGRSFAAAGVGSRVFAVRAPGDRLDIQDCTAITEVASNDSAGSGFSTVWAAADWQAEPLNGVRDGVAGWPVCVLRAVGRCWPAVGPVASVRVTASFGWPVVPVPVTQACLLLSAKLYKRRDTPEGLVGFEGAGVRAILSQDRDATALIAPYMRAAI